MGGILAVDEEQHASMLGLILARQDCTATALCQTDHIKAASFWERDLCHTVFQLGAKSGGRCPGHLDGMDRLS